MTTLNARANQAYHAVVEESGEDWMGFSHQRDAFEEGWETGYKARDKELAYEYQHRGPSDDYFGIDFDQGWHPNNEDAALYLRDEHGYEIRRRKVTTWEVPS